MTKAIKRYGFLLAFLLPWVSYAQNAKEDFLKIKAAHSSQGISMDLIYQIYRSAGDQTPVGTETGKLVKAGEKSYLQIGETETIQNGSFCLLVDRETRLITILPAEKTMGNTEKLFSMNFEQMLSLCKKIEFIKGAGQNQYILSLPEGSEFSMFRLSYNSKTFLVEKLELYYRNSMNLTEDEKEKSIPPKVCIVYKNIKINPTIDPALFSYSAFMKKENGKLVLREPYKGFQFINQYKAD